MKFGPLFSTLAMSVSLSVLAADVGTDRVVDDGIEGIMIEEASAIFVAQVISAKLVGPDQTSSRLWEIEGRYKLLDSIKGSVSAEGELKTVMPNDGLYLTPGMVYLFVVVNHPYVDCCAGSKVLFSYTSNGPMDQVERRVLEKIKQIVKESD